MFCMYSIIHVFIHVSFLVARRGAKFAAAGAKAGDQYQASEGALGYTEAD